MPHDRRLIGEGHADLETRLVFFGDERTLVYVHADAVPHPVAEVGAEARVLDWLPASSVDLGGGRSPFGRRLPGRLRIDHGLVCAPVLGCRLAAEDGAAEIGAVAVQDRAEIEQDRLSLAQR